jgi:DNA-binding CsgD family transcriptional regulator
MTTHISMDTESPATGLGLTPLPTSSPVRHLCGGPESDGRRLVREQFSGANGTGAPADVFVVLDEVLDGGLLELGARLEIVRANSWWSRHGLGFGVNELVGRRLGEVVEDADGGWSDRFGQWAVQPDGAFVHELRLVLPANASNSTVWIELTLRRAKSGGDRGTAYLALARDVTEGRREREEARAALELAADGFDRLGARPWADRARAEFRAARVQTGRSVGEPVKLSTQERRVAELAATGRTTKEIAVRLSLSPRTIDNHLHRAFRRLGVSRRDALSEALKKQDNSTATDTA